MHMVDAEAAPLGVYDIYQSINIFLLICFERSVLYRIAFSKMLIDILKLLSSEK